MKLKNTLAILCGFLLALSPLFVEASGHASTTEALRAAAARGSIDLGKIPAFAATPLRTITITRPDVTDSGEVFGSARLGSADASVALHSVRPELTDAAGAWVLAIDATAGRLSDIVPPLEGTVADGFELGRSAIVLSTATVRVDETALSPRTARFYRNYFDSPRMLMQFASGVNCITRVTPGSGSAIGSTLKILGLDKTPDGLLLQGCVLKDATYSELEQAKKDGDLKNRIRESMELRAYLPPVAIAGLPDSYDTGEASLVVSGKPGVGVAFRLLAPGKTAASTQAFECRVDVAAADLGATETKIMGTAQGEWPSALGIAGFDLIDTRLILSVDNQQKVSFGVRAALGMGRKQMAVAAKLQLHAVTGVPVGGFFEGSLDSLGSRDLVEFANHMGKAANKKPLKGDAIPEFELRDLYMKFAPLAGDSDLGVSDGFALSGELHAFDRKFAFVDGEINLNGVVPEIAIRGECGDIDLSGLALKGAAVDIKMGLSKDQHFRLKGQTQLLAMRRSVDVNCGLKSLYFDTWEELAGVYRTEYHVSSPAKGKPSWNLRAAFRNDFSKTLEKEVSRRALDWARKAERDFEKAQQGLDEAIAKVNEIDRGIAAMRRKVKSNRAKHQRNLATARSKVESLQKQIQKIRSEINTKRNEKKGELAGKKKKKDAAHRAWKKAVANRKKAKPWKKPKLKAIEAAKFTAFKAKEAAYNTARIAYAAMVKVPVDASPRIVAVFAAKKTADAALAAAQKVVAKFPVDADPRIAAQFAAREVAEAALKVAKGFVAVTEKAALAGAKVTAWAAKNNGKLLMLDSASFAAQLAGFLKGNKVNFKSAVRFLGKPQTVNLRLSPGDFKGDRLFKDMWAKLKDTVK